MTNIRRQLLRGSLVGLLLVPTVLACFVVGAFFFGYRFVTAHGTSMEPTLRDGDMIWVKYLDIADVKVGDIVTLRHSALGWVTHRVIDVQPISREGYLLVTKGDANWIPEEWQISADQKVGVTVASFRVFGLVLDLLETTPVRVLLLGIMVAVVALLVMVYRTRKGYQTE